MKAAEVHNVECLEFMRAMDADSVDAIITDPPYFKVKGEAWDNQWNTPEKFIEWIGDLSEQWQRILKPNGCVYVFASPKMSARVEVKMSERFEILQNLVWFKDSPGMGAKQEKEALRNWWPGSERIVYAQHKGGDIANGYTGRSDDARGRIMEPLRAYLDGERIRAGFDREACDRVCENRMSGHYFSAVQWHLPTEANYLKLRAAFGAGYLERDHAELWKEYERLRDQYDAERATFEHLRRPFNVTPEDQYTDVWKFRSVQAYEGKHVCEKPLALMEHVILSSTRPGDVVFDGFTGSGSTGVAAVLNGRRFIGCELDVKHAADAAARIAKHEAAPRLF